MMRRLALRPETARAVSGAAATLACLAAGTALVAHLTADMTVFTTESWRRAQVRANPWPLPDVSLQDHEGSSLRLHDLCARPVVVDFVFTRCTTVCRSSGAISSQLARRLDEHGLHSRVVSVTFDPTYDTSTQLASFKRAMEPLATSWLLVRPQDAAGRTAVLEAFGVTVIPDGSGGFDHNAGLHLVRGCQLVNVLDTEDVDGAFQAVRQFSESKGS